MKNPFSCITCHRNPNETTTIVIKSGCFNKPIRININNDDEKYKVIHELIWALVDNNNKKELSTDNV
jgi:hypothetical protein